MIPVRQLPLQNSQLFWPPRSLEAFGDGLRAGLYVRVPEFGQLAPIPFPRPAPASLMAVTTPIQPDLASAQTNISSPETVPSRPAAPTTVASPKTGDVFMPIPPMPVPFRNETDASSGALSTRDSRKAE